MEDIFKSYQYTIQFLSVFGTWIAVILSLVLAFKAYLRKNKAFVIRKCNGYRNISFKNRESKEGYTFEVHNLLEHPIDILESTFILYDARGMSFLSIPTKLDNINISPVNQKKIDVELNCDLSLPIYSLSIPQTKKIELKVETSVGEKVYKLNKKEFSFIIGILNTISKKGVSYNY